MSIGGIIAIITLILCVVLAVVGGLTPLITLGLIGALALAILLSAYPLAWRTP